MGKIELIKNSTIILKDIAFMMFRYVKKLKNAVTLVNCH